MEAEFQPNLKRMMHINQNIFFKLDLVDLVFFNNIRFIHNFHSIKLTTTSFLSQYNLPESAPSQHLYRIEIVFSDMPPIYNF